MTSLEMFPLSLATGKVFCNRDAERAQLKQHLVKNRHTILISPRRYGKTSLMLQVFTEVPKTWVCGNIDFLMAADAESVQERILNCVGQVIPKILPSHKKALAVVKRFIASVSPKLVISETGATIEFSSSQRPQDTIIEALLALDEIAREQKKRVALLFDEFQQVGAMRGCEVIEASIRHVAERAKYTSYVFSGNNRHLLTSMFDDSARPLYHLCEKLVLNRISIVDYHKHLQACANMKWHSILEDSVINTILTFTHRHSYYTNLLCSRLWEYKRLPKVSDVALEWQRYVDGEQGRIANEIARLSSNQRAVLQVVATEKVYQPASKQFLNKVRLSTASAMQAINVLLEKDILYKDVEGYFYVLDPSIEFYLKLICA